MIWRTVAEEGTLWRFIMGLLLPSSKTIVQRSEHPRHDARRFPPPSAISALKQTKETEREGRRRGKRTPEGRGKREEKRKERKKGQTETSVWIGRRGPGFVARRPAVPSICSGLNKEEKKKKTTKIFNRQRERDR